MRGENRQQFGFNLVIEVLLISRTLLGLSRSISFLFQSRNRGSFDFKLTDSRIPRDGWQIHCFNLVIEVLLISRIWNTPLQGCR